MAYTRQKKEAQKNSNRSDFELGRNGKSLPAIPLQLMNLPNKASSFQKTETNSFGNAMDSSNTFSRSEYQGVNKIETVEQHTQSQPLQLKSATQPVVQFAGFFDSISKSMRGAWRGTKRFFRNLFSSSDSKEKSDKRKSESDMEFEIIRSAGIPPSMVLSELKKNEELVKQRANFLVIQEKIPYREAEVKARKQIQEDTRLANSNDDKKAPTKDFKEKIWKKEDELKEEAHKKYMEEVSLRSEMERIKKIEEDKKILL